ncbi:MAG TPA: hypothetical protein ENK65_02090 [Helicobacteraceae bacterium]|nr:hypothetical protein [Helicobacteraceae bacterium]
MKKVAYLGLSITVAGLLIGCGGGSGNDSGSTGSFLTGEPVAVTTPEQASNAMSSVTNLNSMGSSGITLSPTRQAAPSLAPVSESENCVDGGSYVISGEATETSADVTSTYNNCTQYGSTLDGTQHVKGSNDGTNVNLVMTMTNFTSSSSGASSTMNMTVNYVANNSIPSLDMILNGTVSYSYTSPISDSGTAGYQNFRVVSQGTNSITIDGDVSTTSTAHSCVDGTYHLETTQTLVPSTSGFSSGQMIVNGATFDFHDNGTATVTFADGSTAVVTQGSEVVCN